jgi:hypothetical protein
MFEFSAYFHFIVGLKEQVLVGIYLSKQVPIDQVHDKLLICILT